MLSRLVITFLPRSKGLLILWLQSPSAVIWRPKNKVCYCFHSFPSICHEVMGLYAMMLVFWMLNIRWIIEKRKRIPENHLLLLHWLYQSLWLGGSQQTVGHSQRDRNTTAPYLTPEKSVCTPEATIRIGYRTMDWFQIGKGVHQGCILSPCLFNLYAEYIMWNTRLNEAQCGIKLQREISVISDMQIASPLWPKAKRN